MTSSNAGTMQIAPDHGWVFQDARQDDMLLYTSRPDQRILLGVTPDRPSAININRNTIQVNQPIKSVDQSLTINGVTLCNDAILFKPSTTLSHQPGTQGLSITRTGTDTLKHLNVRGVVIGQAVPFGQPSDGADDVDYSNTLHDMIITRTLALTGTLVGSSEAGTVTVGAHLLPSSNALYDLGGAPTARWRDVYAHRMVHGYEDSNMRSIDPSVAFSIVSSSNAEVPDLDWAFQLSSASVQVQDQAVFQRLEIDDVFKVGDVLQPTGADQSVTFVSKSPLYAASNVLENSLAGATAFVTRTNANGLPMWASRIRALNGGQTAQCSAHAVALDERHGVGEGGGEVVMAGAYGGAAAGLEFVLTPGEPHTRLLATPQGHGVFVARMDATRGLYRWATVIDGALFGREVADVHVCQSTGHSFVTVNYDRSGVTLYRVTEGTLDYSQPTLLLPPILEGSPSACVVVFDAHGMLQWISRIDSSSDEAAHAIGVHDGMSIAVAGSYTVGNVSAATTVTYGDAPPISVPLSGPEINTSARFLVQYGLGGAVQWSKRVYAAAALSPIQGDVAVDAYGNVTWVGAYHADTDPPPFPGFPAHAAAASLFLANLYPSGDLKWAVPLHGIEAAAATTIRVAIDATLDQAIYVSGTASAVDRLVLYHANAWDAPALDVPAPATPTLFLACYTAQGRLQWVKRARHDQTAAVVRVAALSASATGAVYWDAFFQNTDATPTSGTFEVEDASPIQPFTSVPWATAQRSNTLAIKYAQRVTYRLASNVPEAQQGMLKTVYNGDPVAVVTLEITDAYDLLTLRALSVSPRTAHTFLWHGGSWKHVSERAVQQGGRAALHALTVGDSNVAHASITPAGELVAKSMVLSQPSLMVQDALQRSHVLAVQSDRIETGVSLLPTSSDALSLGAPTHRFEAVHTQKAYAGIHALDALVAPTQESVSVLTATDANDVYVLPPPHQASNDAVSNGYVKTFVNAGSQVARVRVENESSNLHFELPPTDTHPMALSLIRYDSNWHVLHRDTVTHQDITPSGITVPGRLSTTPEAMRFDAPVNLQDRTWIAPGSASGNLRVTHSNGGNGATLGSITVQALELGTTEAGFAWTHHRPADTTPPPQVRFEFLGEDGPARVLLTAESNALRVPDLHVERGYVEQLRAEIMEGVLTLDNEGNQIRFVHAGTHAHRIQTAHADASLPSSNLLHLHVNPFPSPVLTLTGEGNVLVDGGGNVGIGTQVPDERLHVHGGAIKVSDAERARLLFAGGVAGASWEIAADSNSLALGTVEHPTMLRCRVPSPDARLEAGVTVFEASSVRSNVSDHEPIPLLHLQRGETMDAHFALSQSNDHAHMDVVVSDRAVMRLCANGNVGVGLVEGREPQAALHVHGTFVCDAPPLNQLAGFGGAGGPLTYADVGPIPYHAEPDVATFKWTQLLRLPRSAYHWAEVEVYFMRADQQSKIRLLIQAHDRHNAQQTTQSYFHSEIIQGNVDPGVEGNLVVYQSGSTHWSVWAKIPPGADAVCYIRTTDRAGVQLTLVSVDSPDSSVSQHDALSQYALKHVADNRSLYIGGAMFAQQKYFRIPHPEPAKRDLGWQLQHSTVEAPTRGENMYRFTVQAEKADDLVRVSLPSYFFYLNEAPQVWVSARGMYAQGWADVDEAAQAVAVHCEKPGAYNVLVIGTRKDADAVQHFRGVEVQPV